MKKLVNSEKTKEQIGYGDDKNEISPQTPSPSSMGKGKGKGKGKKKKLKEIMHVKSGDQSNKIIMKKVPKLIKVSSNRVTKIARSKGINRLSKTSTVIKAEEVMAKLDPKFPSFLRAMVRSHVSSCFWMGLSTEFCRSHLPKKDMMFTVEDESGKEFQIKYLFERTGLSGGWKRFAIDKKLVEEDVVIFQLTKPSEPIKLKVYIIRANDVANEDGAIVRVNLDALKQHNDDEKSSSEISQKPLRQYSAKRKLLKSLQGDTLQKKKKTGLGIAISKTSILANNSKNEDEESDIEIIPDPSNTPSQVQFKDVKSFEDFTISAADGISIDSEIPDHIRRKYYELCLAKNTYLHAHLIQGLNTKLIAGIISETVNIADSVKKCGLITCRSEFANWERALKSFHFMGMRVGFIIARIRKIVRCTFDSEDAIQSRKYIAAKLEKVLTEDQLVNLKSKFDELKESYKKCSGDVKALKLKAEGYERKFQEEVDAPW